MIPSLKRIHHDKPLMQEFDRFLQSTKDELKLQVFVELQEYREKEIITDDEKSQILRKLLMSIDSLDSNELNLNTASLCQRDLTDTFIKALSTRLQILLSPLYIEFLSEKKAESHPLSLVKKKSNGTPRELCCQPENIKVAFDTLIANPRLFTIYKLFSSYLGDTAALLELYTDIYVFRHSSFKPEEMVGNARNILQKITNTTIFTDNLINTLRDALSTGNVTITTFDEPMDILYSVLLQHFTSFWREGSLTKKQEKLLLNSNEEFKFQEFVNELMIFENNPSSDLAKTISDKLGSFQSDLSFNILSDISRKIQNGQIDSSLFHPLIVDYLEKKKVSPKLQRGIPSKIWDLVK